MVNLPKNFIKEFGYTDIDNLEYIRDRKHNPIGVFVTKGVCVGWSLCHDGDKWDSATGIFIAACRLKKQQTFDLLEIEIKDKLEEIFNKRELLRDGVQKRVVKFDLFMDFLKRYNARIKVETNFMGIDNINLSGVEVEIDPAREEGKTVEAGND